MGYWMVKVGGTKTTATNSTPGDWSTASNYFNSIVDAITKGADAADHEIVLYDETHTLTDLNFGTANATTGTLWKISSAGGDPNNCILSFTTTTQPGMRLGRDTRAFTYEFTGIGFTRTNTNTANKAGLIYCEYDDVADVTFSDCIFRDASNVYSGVGAQTHFRFPPGLSARTVTFTDCSFNALTSEYTGGIGLFNATAGNTVIFDGCVWSGCSTVWTGDGVEGAGAISGTADYEFLNCQFDACTQEHQSSTVIAMAGFINVNGDLVVDGLVVNDCIQTGGTAGDFIRANSTFTVANMLFLRNVSTPGEDTARWNSSGGGFRAITDSAQGTGDSIVSIDCVSDHGTALYVGDGAGGTWTNIIALRCHSRAQGNIYFGGWGDNTLDGFAILGALGGTESVTGSTDGVPAIYAHLRPSGATRSKTTNISNGEIRCCRNALGKEAGICIKNESGTYIHTANISNVVMDNPGSITQLSLSETVNGIINAVVDISVVGVDPDAAFVDEREAPTGTLSLSIDRIVRAVQRGQAIGQGVMRS